MEEVGHILTALRKERNLAQKELASLLSLSVGTISNYENGVHSPDLTSLCTLADFYGVTTDYLLGRTGYRFDPITLNRHILEDYTILDIVDSILICEKNGSLKTLMEYADYLGKKDAT